MIDMEKMRQVLTQYKTDFPTYWDQERYKWEAVLHFQNNWDLNAADFGQMFKEATKKTVNLLNSGHAYPGAMICDFAAADGEATREMFRALFDGTETIPSRVKAFQASAEEMKTKYNDGTWRNHYQSTNAVSTYLWLRFPKKYYIYKYQIVRSAAVLLESNHTPKADGSVESMMAGYELYDEIRAAVKADHEVCELIGNALKANPGCYDDPELVTAAIDVAYYLGTRYQRSPGLSVQDWSELLKDASVFDEQSLLIMARMMDFGGEATCKQLSERYGGTPNFYNKGSSTLAQRVAEKMHCPPMRDDDGNIKWWPILYLGKNADPDTPGVFVWRLRDELREALEHAGLPPAVAATPGAYTEQDFLHDVFLDKAQFDDLKNLLLNSKNLILQGAPGVGKTFAAKKLAYAVMGRQDDSRIELVQFHQNYSYEDFVMGYRPKETGGFSLERGVFLRFCERAADDPGNRYFFIIDEINRGNLSKIFGELLMLIEKDKRGKHGSAALAYMGNRFSVPENVFIIGMMNTADRSLAMIDYALRRRFRFFDMKPAFDSDGFRNKQKRIGSATFDQLIRKIKELNQVIADDNALGPGFQIGHSYFCEKPDGIPVGKWLELVVNYEIVPLLQEYWFDDHAKWETWKKALDVSTFDADSGRPAAAPATPSTGTPTPSGDSTTPAPEQ